MLNDPRLHLLQFAGIYFLVCCNVFSQHLLGYSAISIYFYHFYLFLFRCVQKRSRKRRCSEFEGAFSDYEANSHWCTSGRPSIWRQASVTLWLAIVGGQFFSKAQANNKHIISMLSLFPESPQNEEHVTCFRMHWFTMFQADISWNNIQQSNWRILKKPLGLHGMIMLLPMQSPCGFSNGWQDLQNVELSVGDPRGANKKTCQIVSRWSKVIQVVESANEIHCETPQPEMLCVIFALESRPLQMALGNQPGWM